MSSDGRYPVAFKECLITPAGREEMDNSWLARLAAKLQATLIVSQRVCMCVGNMLNISETRRHGGFVSNRDPIEKSLRWVDWWRHRWRHLTVYVVTCKWCHNIQSRRILKLYWRHQISRVGLHDIFRRYHTFYNHHVDWQQQSLKSAEKCNSVASGEKPFTWTSRTRRRTVRYPSLRTRIRAHEVRTRSSYPTRPVDLSETPRVK